MRLPEFELSTLSGEARNLSDFPGKAWLIVNTASHCAFTKQYAALEQLHQEFAARGLVIMGFPCDQFGHQEPGDHAEIAQFCQRNFGVSFPMFAKTDVNGERTHPLFRFLKEKAPGLLGSHAIKWNFTKFLFVPEQNQVLRYAPLFPPNLLRKKIGTILTKPIDG
ncbi:glutathione peroxidase [Undibacterium cyanobacteriorum]|uniref:Glutathione peroxidase n=1 Tax=Undibacterium cyanobacteriorum TaxID=3073561 RepID=A0ABY9RG52_9BURK|nr:glutathione peroxidase [Undibacterium sp. 20NA77.5]WMW79921.1 glutathione peroxidase [Undibacterium sp. 20NA77.5]